MASKPTVGPISALGHLQTHATHQVLERKKLRIPKAAIGITGIGDAKSAAERVRSKGYRVRGSDVDLLGVLDSVVDLDTKGAHCAFELRMPAPSREALHFIE